MAQRITAEEAAALIQDNMTLGVGGFGAYAAPDELLSALAERYERLGSPRALTAVCGISPGSNRPDGRGLARLRAPGLLDTVMAGHFANPPEIAELIGTNQVAAYALPLGVMLHLWRAIAGHKPAVLTHVGLGTFADPRVEGCKANQKTRAQGRDIVELVSLDGRDYLAYKTFPIDACFIRATWADEDGSLSMEDEGVGDYAAELAAATHNSGGIVIAQVRGIVSRGSLPPKSVRVHHPMVDYVVVNTDPALHMQSYAAQLRPELSGQLRRPTDSIPPMPLDNRKLIARRGALELRPDCLINLGIGIPSGVGVVANEEGIAQRITLSLESGPQGGVPVEGAGFGSAVNAEAIYTVADTLELYDGGMLDLSFLGAAEVDYLAYKTFPIDACFIRATWADEDGSLSMEDEGVGDYAAELAAATHNSGGIVIAQVRGIVSRGSLPPKSVRVHHPMVDYVVVNTDPALHMQSYAAQLRPELSGQLRRPTDSIPPMPLDNRKLIARRGALELRPDCLINLGIGIPSGVGVVANEEGIAQRITLSLESGPQGGVPVEGAGFGSAVNAEAIYTVADTLELYDGGMLDLSFLGAAEVDCHGNVNVSKFGSRCTGPGGFVNISQNTKRVFFTGTFTAGGLKEEVRDGRLVILQEGRSKKFRRQVEQITFSGDYAVKSGQDVTFLTERAVLKLTPDGLMLTEIAPGVELEQDILAQMEFRPLISPELREMDHRIFQAGPMGLTL